MADTVQLGQRARDRMTGFHGIVVSRHEYLNGCVRFGIQPEALDRDGKVREDKVFDQEQLEQTASQARTFTRSPNPSGGPHRDDHAYKEKENATP